MLLKIVVVYLMVVSAADAFACQPDICAVVDCVAITADTCNGRIVRNGGYCGCCDACVRGLVAGEACTPSPLLGAPTNTDCGPNLYCDSTTLTCKALPLAS